MKVYLSRSNQANPGVFSIVKQVIEDLGHEVVTFEGGSYSKLPLLECQALVIVPGADMLPGIERGKYNTVLLDIEPYVGKGQYEQCKDFAKKHAVDYDLDDEDMEHIELPGYVNMIVVREVNTKDSNNPSVYVDNVHSILTADKDDWKSCYGYLRSYADYTNIGAVLGREMQTDIPTCKEELLYPVSNSPMLGAASMLGLL